MILGQILGWGMRARFGERALIGSGPGILARIPSELCEAPTSGCSVGRLHVYSWPCEVTVPVIIPISRVITQEGGEPEAVVQLAECLPSIGPWVTPPALHKPSMVVCVIPARRSGGRMRNAGSSSVSLVPLLSHQPPPLSSQGRR